jgi:hypothetical protein
VRRPVVSVGNEGHGLDDAVAESPRPRAKSLDQLEIEKSLRLLREGESGKQSASTDDAEYRPEGEDGVETKRGGGTIERKTDDGIAVSSMAPIAFGSSEAEGSASASAFDPLTINIGSDIGTNAQTTEDSADGLDAKISENAGDSDRYIEESVVVPTSEDDGKSITSPAQLGTRQFKVGGPEGDYFDHDQDELDQSPSLTSNASRRKREGKNVGEFPFEAHEGDLGDPADDDGWKEESPDISADGSWNEEDGEIVVSPLSSEASLVGDSDW